METSKNSSNIVSHFFILVGLAMFANAGFSMLSFRRMAAEKTEEGLIAPLDIQIEIGIALFFSVCGAIGLYS